MKLIIMELFQTISVMWKAILTFPKELLQINENHYAQKIT